MTGTDLKAFRTASKLTQTKAAERLGVTQAYLSMLERGSRTVSDDLEFVALRVFSLVPTARPMGKGQGKRLGEEGFKRALGELGYPGFAYLKGRLSLNPVELLLLALDSEELDSRVTEALPWLPFKFPEMKWDWLITEAKLRDRQNRLAYITSLAVNVADARGKAKLSNSLRNRVADLERSRLANEDTLAKSSLSEAERKWLRAHRSRSAAHWNLLTDLTEEGVQNVF